MPEPSFSLRPDPLGYTCISSSISATNSSKHINHNNSSGEVPVEQIRRIFDDNLGIIFFWGDSNEYPRHLFYGELQKMPLNYPQIPSLSVLLSSVVLATSLLSLLSLLHLSRLMTKLTKWHVRPAKTQISLGMRPVLAVRMKKAWFLSYPFSAQRRLWSDWADAQVDLSLR